jgi:tetratricopeptide (TPR) repeat protein
MLKLSEVDAMLADIKPLLQAGDFPSAEKKLLTLAEDAAEHEEVLYMLAVCQRYLNKYTTALETLNRVKRLNPDHSRAHQETGHVYRALNNAGAALNAFSRATQINPALESSLRAQIEILNLTDRSGAAETFSGSYRFDCTEQARKG